MAEAKTSHTQNNSLADPGGRLGFRRAYFKMPRYIPKGRPGGPSSDTANKALTQNLSSGSTFRDGPLELLVSLAGLCRWHDEELSWGLFDGTGHGVRVRSCLEISFGRSGWSDRCQEPSWPFQQRHSVILFTQIEGKIHHL